MSIAGSGSEEIRLWGRQGLLYVPLLIVEQLASRGLNRHTPDRTAWLFHLLQSNSQRVEIFYFHLFAVEAYCSQAAVQHQKVSEDGANSPCGSDKYIRDDEQVSDVDSWSVD